MAAGAAVVTVAAGLGVRAVGDGAFSKYAGDALYTVVVYLLVVMVVGRVRPWVAAVTAVSISWAIELFQLTGIPSDLSDKSAVSRLVLGSTFNAPDLFWYAVGAVSAGFIHERSRRGHRRVPLGGGSPRR